MTRSTCDNRETNETDTLVRSNAFDVLANDLRTRVVAAKRIGLAKAAQVLGPTSRRSSSMAKKRISASRRGFLLAVGAGGVATAAAAVQSVAPVPEKPETAARAADKGGYQMSENINKYYRTTRV